jgi:hypothetical protein
MWIIEKWIPAFAGMTNMEIAAPFGLRPQWLAMTGKNHFPPL